MSLSAKADSATVNDSEVPNTVGGCFVAGTLVWIDKGLVPIEEIKVGDRVLSQPEGTGEQAYRPVITTVSFEKKEVWLLEYYLEDGKVLHRVVGTPNHPFWVVKRKCQHYPAGWVGLCGLDSGDEIELQDGRKAFVCVATPLWIMEEEGIAWASDDLSSMGHSIDFRGGGLQWNEEDFDYNPIARESENPEFCARVYNFEVEGFHTYYVTEHGIWVHVSYVNNPATTSETLDHR